MKIISGGQTGVDQAALRAARRASLTTGGWAPRGWMTLDGPAPWLAEYGLVEHPGGYAARTEANVRDADATLRIARNFKSAGERCTLRAIIGLGRPHLSLLDLHLGESSDRLKSFLAENDVRVLNVAGNSEQTAPGIGALAERFLVEVFTIKT